MRVADGADLRSFDQQPEFLSTMIVLPSNEQTEKENFGLVTHAPYTRWQSLVIVVFAFAFNERCCRLQSLYVCRTIMPKVLDTSSRLV